MAALARAAGASSGLRPAQPQSRPAGLAPNRRAAARPTPFLAAAAPPELIALTKKVTAAGRAKRPEDAVAAVAEAAAAGVPPDARLGAALIDACVGANRLDLAQASFKAVFDDGGVAPDEAAFVALLRGCARADPPRWAEAGRVLASMPARGVQPGAASYNALVAAAGAAGDTERGLAVLAQMVAARVPPDAGTAVAVSKRRTLRSALRKMLEAEAAEAEAAERGG